MLRAVRVTARQIVPAVRTVVRGARARARPFRDLESRSILRAAAHPPRVAESDMRMCKRTAVRPGCSLFTPRGARSRDRCGWRAGTSEAAIETIDRTIVIAAYVSGSWRDDDHPASPEQVAQHQRPDKTEREAGRELGERPSQNHPADGGGLCPSAIRTPISCVRCATAYAIAAWSPTAASTRAIAAQTPNMVPQMRHHHRVSASIDSRPPLESGSGDGRGQPLRLR